MDIDKTEFIDDFIEDMNDLMSNAEISLKKLEDNHSLDLINELFRVAHSIKGMSASMEFKRLEMLTHKIEDLMYVVRDGTLEFSQDILEILQIGFAFLNELFTSVKLSGVEDCVRVTQQVGAMLDVHDPISGEYALEVSSPGWDRPFFQLSQMSGYIGHQVALRLIAAVENRRKFQAKLITVDLENEMIQVEVEGKHVLEIDSHNIDKANLIYQD